MQNCEDVGLEWSGICRATRSRFGDKYWAISDSTGHKRGWDSRLHLVDQYGNIHGNVPVLSPGGGNVDNRDWEDICMDNRRNILILDNRKNNQKLHSVIRVKEPDNLMDMPRFDLMVDFKLRKDVEAMFAVPSFHSNGLRQLKIIPKHRRMFAALSPMYAYHFASFESVDSDVWPLYRSDKAMHGLFGFCTAADFYPSEMFSDDLLVGSSLFHREGLLLVHTYLATYVCDYPYSASVQIRRSSLGQSEGACFTHDAESVLITNESGEHFIIPWRHLLQELSCKVIDRQKQRQWVN